MTVTFRTIPYGAFPNPPADPQDLECPTCLNEFKPKEILVGHEGIGILGHPLHESCFKRDILRQHKLGLEIATCNTCRKNILNTNDYLPVPSWTEKTIQAVREFSYRHKTITGIALGAVSMLGTSLLKINISHWISQRFLQDVMPVILVTGFPPCVVSLLRLPGMDSVNTEDFSGGMILGALAVGAATQEIGFDFMGNLFLVNYLSAAQVIANG